MTFCRYHFIITAKLEGKRATKLERSRPAADDLKAGWLLPLHQRNHSHNTKCLGFRAGDSDHDMPGSRREETGL